MEKYLKTCDISNDFCALNSHLQISPINFNCNRKNIFEFFFCTHVGKTKLFHNGLTILYSKVWNKLSNESASKQKSGYELTDIFQFEDF